MNRKGCISSLVLFSLAVACGDKEFAVPNGVTTVELGGGACRAAGEYSEPAEMTELGPFVVSMTDIGNWYLPIAGDVRLTPTGVELAQVELKQAGDGSWVVFEGRVQLDRFVQDGTGTLSSQDDYHLRLTAGNGGYFIRDQRDGASSWFALCGSRWLLRESRDSFGRVDTSYVDDGNCAQPISLLQSQNYQAMDVSRDAQGRITTVVDGDGVSVTLEYEPLTGKLARLNYPDSSGDGSVIFDMSSGFPSQMRSDGVVTRISYASSNGQAGPYKVTSGTFEATLSQAQGSAGTDTESILTTRATIGAPEMTRKVLWRRQAGNCLPIRMSSPQAYRSVTYVPGTRRVAEGFDSQTGVRDLFTYGAYGKLASYRRTGEVPVDEIYQYDARGRVTRTTDQLASFVVDTAYNDHGQVTMTDDSVSPRVFYEYDPNHGGLTAIKNSTGQVIRSYTHAVNGAGFVMASTATDLATGAIGQVGLDQAGRITDASAGGISSGASYTAGGRLATSRGPLGLTRQLVRDPLDQHVTAVQEDGSIVSDNTQSHGGGVHRTRHTSYYAGASRFVDNLLEILSGVGIRFTINLDDNVTITAQTNMAPELQ